MIGQAIIVGLIAALGNFDYQLGTLYLFRPIVMCPLVGLALGDLQTGLAVGASLELLFMGSISIGAYIPPDATIGGVLSCAFAISLGQGTEAAIALAMPIAVLALALKNILAPIYPFFVDKCDTFAKKGSVAGIYGMHWLIGLSGCAVYFFLCAGAYAAGVEAVQAALDWIPQFIMDGFGIAANILPAMGFAMLGRLVITRELVPFYFLGFIVCAYAGVPVLGVAILAIIIGIEKFDLMHIGSAQTSVALEGDDDDDF